MEAGDPAARLSNLEEGLANIMRMMQLRKEKEEKLVKEQKEEKEAAWRKAKARVEKKKVEPAVT